MALVPSGVGFWWPGTAASIPSGWARNTNFDDRFAKGTAASVNPDVTGGASTHTHTAPTHSHTVASHTHSGTSPGGDTNAAAISDPTDVAAPTHTHAYTEDGQTATGGSSGTSSWNTPTFLPSWFQAIYIESDGTPTNFPDDVVAYFDSATAPTSWVQHAGSEGRFFRGAAAAGDGGGTGGGGGHSHTGSSHGHGTSGNHIHANPAQTSTNTESVQTGRSSSDSIIASHTHGLPSTDNSGAVTISNATGAASASTTYEPSRHKLLAVQNTSGAAVWTENIIGMWLGTLASIPTDWILCDGGSGTPDLRDRFILNDASGGGDHGETGGSDGHTHSAGSGHTHGASHTHTQTIDNIASPDDGLGTSGVTAAADNHGHGSSTTTSAGATTSDAEPIDNNSDTQPPFRTIAYIQAPAEPIEYAGGSAAVQMVAAAVL